MKPKTNITLPASLFTSKGGIIAFVYLFLFNVPGFVNAQNNTYPYPSSGSIGIGTTSPLSRLTVKSTNVPNYGILSVQDANGSGGSGQAFVSFAGADNVRLGYLGSSYGSFVIQNDYSNIVSISPSSSGKVLIGSFTNYGHMLQVNGNSYLQGNVGIGTTNTGSFKLAVEGKIGAREVQVTLATPWPDYVFKPDYKLYSLNEVREYIAKNNHLPDMPKAADVEKDGINLGEMNAKLLRKIEELTLYILELKIENDDIKKLLQKVKKS